MVQSKVPNKDSRGGGWLMCSSPRGAGSVLRLDGGFRLATPLLAD